MDEAMLDSEKAMTTFLQPDRRRARHRARAGHDRQLQVERDRGRPEVRAGQGDRQLDLDEGGRGRVPAPGAPGRRYGAAVVVMAFDEKGQADTLERRTADLPARLRAAHRAVGLPARGHHLRSEHLRRRHRARGARELRHRLHRGGALDPRQPAACEGLGRRLQPVVLVPRQRPGARGDAHRVPLPRDPAPA